MPGRSAAAAAFSTPALEQLAVRQVVARATKADLDAIEAAAVRMDRAGDVIELVALDIAFHDAVYAAARHQRLDQAWRAIRSQVHLFLLTRVRASTDGYLAHVPGEHQDLVAALRARDGDTALGLFAAHRRVAFDVVTRSVPEAT